MKTKKQMFKDLTIIFMCFSVALFSALTVYADPEEATERNYFDEFINGVGDTFDDIRNNWGDSTEATEPYEDTTEYYEEPTEYYDEYNDYDDDYYADEEVATEQPTLLYDEPDENYDYSYEPPERDDEYVYEPEILTETYTDAPFLERVAFENVGEGNLFVAVGLWVSIFIGIIIVMAICIATHRRKMGN